MGAQAGRLLEFAFEVGAADSLDGFRLAVAFGIGRVVPCDLASYTEVDLESRSTVVVLDRPVSGAEGVVEAFGRLAHQHPLVTRADGHAQTISDYLTPREFSRLELYGEVYRPLGARDQIAINLPAGPRRAVGVALNRARPSFSGPDRDMLELVRPLLARAYRQVQARERGRELLTQLQRGTTQEAAVAVYSSDGHLKYASDRALGLVRTYLDGAEPMLAAWLGDPRGRMPLTIEKECGAVELAPAAAGDPDLVLLELRERPTVTRLAVLTARERQLLAHLAAGESNHEIADTLGISRHTVQNHLRSIYRKLDVTSRTSAVAVLRLESPAYATGSSATSRATSAA